MTKEQISKRIEFLNTIKKADSVLTVFKEDSDFEELRKDRIAIFDNAEAIFRGRVSKLKRKLKRKLKKYD